MKFQIYAEAMTDYDVCCHVMICFNDDNDMQQRFQARGM